MEGRLLTAVVVLGTFVIAKMAGASHQNLTGDVADESKTALLSTESRRLPRR